MKQRGSSQKIMLIASDAIYTHFAFHASKPQHTDRAHDDWNLGNMNTLKAILQEWCQSKVQK